MYTQGIITRYYPPYHRKLHDEYMKMKSASTELKDKFANSYHILYENILHQEKWERLASQEYRDEIDRYHKTNPIRRCLKCNQYVTAGGNTCTYTPPNYDTVTNRPDPTRTAYYDGDDAVSSYNEFFRNSFTLCLAIYPKGDTMFVSNGGLMCFNHTKE